MSGADGAFSGLQRGEKRGIIRGINNKEAFVMATEEIFNAETVAALEEAEEMLNNPEKYKRYATFREALESLEALEDAKLMRNLYGPYDTGAEAVKAMLKD